MKEQRISLDVAKLAKECGFKPEREWNPEYVPGYVDYSIVTDEPEKGTPLTEFKEEDYSCEGFYLAPTQSVLQKWLREKHKIVIIIEPYNSFENKDEYYLDLGYSYSTLCFTKEPDGKILRDVICSSGARTYEQALEFALHDGLRLVNNPFRRPNKLTC